MKDFRAFAWRSQKLFVYYGGNKEIKMIRIKRITKNEKRYSRKMGLLDCNVTRIQKTIFGFPFKQLHAYRETYYGEVKSLSDCDLHK